MRLVSAHIERPPPGLQTLPPPVFIWCALLYFSLLPLVHVFLEGGEKALLIVL